MVVAQQTITPLALFHATTMCGVTVIALLKTQGEGVWLEQYGFMCASRLLKSLQKCLLHQHSHTLTPPHFASTRTHTHTLL